MGILDAAPVSPLQFNQQLSNNGVAAITETDADYLPFSNVARYTEDFSWAYYNKSGTAATPGTTKKAVVDGRLITLSQVTTGGFNDSIEARYASASLTPFVAGKKYLLSMYVYSDVDVFFWSRTVANSSAQGHGVRFSKAGLLRRVWTIGQATSTTALDLGAAAETALGSGAGENARVIQQGNKVIPAGSGLYIGGIQIESVASTTKLGVAWQGDSTMAGASGKLDLPRDFTDPNLREVSTMVSAYLNCNCYNRAVGGERLDQMDTRWAADITPLAANSKYVVIQGGINDIGQGRTLAQMQASLQSMAAKAATDGFEVRYLTVTPTSTIAGTPAMEALRQTYNAWLKSTYGALVIDIAPFVTDPETGNTLLPAYWGDGTHYPGIAKTTIGRYIAKNGGMTFTTPSRYQRQQS